MLSTLWFWIRALKWSVVAFGVSLVLGLVSMGFLGAGLYFLVSPVLRLRFPPIDQWQGDWVWPALIVTGMAWSFGFLFAGVANYYLVSLHTPAWPRRLVYLGILWLWALAVWFLTLRFPPN